VKLFSRGHGVGSRTLTYESTWSEAVTGIIQILLHELDVLCDRLLVGRELPRAAADLDAALSGVFQSESVTAAVPALAFEKFLESYRFTGGTCMRVWCGVVV